MDKLADVLKREMRRLGHSEYRVGQLVGLSAQAVHGLLNGSEPRFSTYLKLVQLFPILAAPVSEIVAHAHTKALEPKPEEDLEREVEDESAPSERDDEDEPQWIEAAFESRAAAYPAIRGADNGAVPRRLGAQIGKRVSELALARNLSLSALALAANVWPPTVTALVRGNIKAPSIKLLLLLCKALGINLNEMLAGIVDVNVSEVSMIDETLTQILWMIGKIHARLAALEAQHNLPQSDG